MSKFRTILGLEAKIRRLFICLVFSILLVTFSWNSAHSSVLSSKSEISLKKALELAIRSHPIVLSKKKEVQAAKDDLTGARWQAFPSASFSFRGFEENDNGRTNRDERVFTLSQPVWTGGRIVGNVDLAKAKLEVAKLGVIEAEQSLFIDTVGAFVELNQAESKLAISQSNVEEHERLSNIIERRVGASTSPEVDARLASARLAFSRSQLLQNKNAVSVSKARLEQLVGEPIYRIQSPKAHKKSKNSLEEIERDALLFSPTIRRVNFEIAGLKASGRVANSVLFPQLSIGYEKKYGELSANQDDEQVFIGLEFQPGAGLSSRFSFTANKERAAALQDTLLALKREVRRDIQITWRELLASEMQLNPAKLLVDTTSDVKESYLRQYTVGRKSWLDVLNAQRELVQAKYALVGHEAQLISASYKIQILTGGMLSREMDNQND